MKLIVNPHTIEIKKDLVNEKEIDITKCEFEFADEITNDYVKEAYFTFNGTSYKQIIANNECKIPYEVLEQKGQVEVGVVAYLVENEEEIKRYNPSPAYFSTLSGSLKDAENSEPITPSEMEQFEQALNDGLNEVANVNIDANQTSQGGTITITDRDGISKTVYIYNGEKGDKGDTGAKGEKGEKGDKGDKGEQGIQGIQGIPGKDGLNGQDGKDGKDGKDGADGQPGTPGTDGIDGQDGADGFSPIATVTKSGSTATISITDKNGTTTATVSDGINGQDGQDGLDGNDGADATINGVNTLTIQAGSNITLDQQGSTMTINATGGGSGGDVTVIYVGKISQYNTTANALNITNYSANTRLILKHNDSSSSMYIKFNNSTQVLYIPERNISENNTVIANNLYYFDINSISSTACNLALTWCQTYSYGAVVSIFKGISYSSGSWTVSNNQYNLLVQPTIHIDISNGTSNVPSNVYWSLWNNTLITTPRDSSSTTVLSKTIASQKPLVHLIGTNYDCVLKFNGYSNNNSRMNYKGTYITETGDIYKVTLIGGNPNSVSLSVTSTKIGTVFEPTTISGYSASSTQTLKNVNGTLTWVTD